MPFFSNPYLTFEGAPTGVHGGDPDGADNALTFELTKGIAANWRASCVSHDPVIPAQPGDILVSNFGSDELLSVDPSSGDRAEISSDEAGSGLLLRGPIGVEMAGDGQVLVASRNNDALLRVDPQNGDRILFSGCANLDCSSVVGTGPDFSNIFMLALESNGDVVVTDRSGPMLFRVARDSGDRAIFSGCLDAACSSVAGVGPVFLNTDGIAVESSGSILVGDYNLRSIFRVDPVTGDRTVISGCVDELCSSSVGSGVAFESLLGIALETDGSILVVAKNSIQWPTFRAIFRVDPITGNRTIVSGCVQFECTSWVGAGAMFEVPIDIALDENGDILLTDWGLHSVFRVNPVSGDRVLLSGCADAACSSVLGGGPWFASPNGIAVVPEPASWLMLIAGTTFLGVLYRRRARGLRIG
jgi:streptogramin lyase